MYVKEKKKKKLKLDSAPLVKGGTEITSSKSVNSRRKIGKRKRKKSKRFTSYDKNE